MTTVDRFGQVIRLTRWEIAVMAATIKPKP
jgi:hypothetical protein